MSLRKNSLINLDFSIQSVEGRKAFIDTLLSDLEKISYTPVDSELELFSNYILYGKDSNGTSIVDRKEVQIQTKFNTYKRKEDQSLEELTESPTFNEATAFNTSPIHYRVKKEKFDRALVKEIPELQPLFNEIDTIDTLLRLYEGKISLEKLKEEATSSEELEDFDLLATKSKKLTTQKVYYLKHLLVELRREQFTLKDFYKPTLTQIPPLATYRGGEVDESIPWQEGIYEIAPLGLYQKGLKRFENFLEDESPDYSYNAAAPFILDFRKPEHLYMIFEMWAELETAAIGEPESTLRPILETVKFYLDRAGLSDEQKDILQYKVNKIPNAEIAEIINRQYGCQHSLNYISTIYKQRICGQIADYVSFHYDQYKERKNPLKWKRCITCGQIKFKDPRCFVRKARSSDGLANRCKECDKAYRELNKLRKGVG